MAKGSPTKAKGVATRTRATIPSKASKPHERFDAAYYGRYYESRRTRVHGAEEVSALARGVSGMITWWGAPFRNVIDLGAGAGLFRDWFRKNLPEIEYRSTEFSAYACERYGHEQRDITSWHSKESYDLVVCQGVLPYVDDAGATRAIENIAKMARGFLYFEAITKRDAQIVCDLDRTDTKVYLRTGSFYRERLGRHFVNVGGGLHYVRGGPLSFYELETLA